MTTGLRRVIRELVAHGDMTVNTARQMLAERDLGGSAWSRIIDDIRREQELRRNGVQKAERAVIEAAMHWFSALDISATGIALDLLAYQCRWLEAEREKLDAEIERNDAAMGRIAE